MNTPRVSVIIPAFNAGKYIAESVESVLAQTYRNFEIVVVNDGSTDDTAEVLRHYVDSGHIRYFEQTNQGASATRNFCIQQAVGDLIAQIDADDLWLPTKLEKQVAVFDSNSHVDAVFCDIIDFSLDGEVASRSRFQQKPPVSGQVLESLLLDGNFIGPTIVVRRGVYENCGAYNTQFKVSEDIEFYLRAAEHHWFDYVDEILVRRRILPISLEHSNIIQIQHNDLKLLTEWSKRRPDLFDLRKPRVAQRMGILHSRLAVEYLGLGKYELARNHFDQAQEIGFVPLRNRFLKIASHSPFLIDVLKRARRRVARPIDR